MTIRRPRLPGEEGGILKSLRLASVEQRADRGDDQIARDASPAEVIEYPDRRWTSLPTIRASKPDVRLLADEAWAVLTDVRPQTLFR
jgi:hypothetical protein